MLIARRGAAVAALVAMTAAAATAVSALPAATAQSAAVPTTAVEYRCTTETPFGSYESATRRFAVELAAPARVRSGERLRLGWSVDRLPEALPVPLRGVSTRTSASLELTVGDEQPTEITERSAAASAPRNVAARDAWPGDSSVTFRPRITADSPGDVLTVRAAAFELEVAAASDGVAGSVVSCVPIQSPVLATIRVTGPVQVGGPDSGPTPSAPPRTQQPFPFPFPFPSATPTATAPEAPAEEGEEPEDEVWDDEAVPVEDVEPPEPRRELIADVRFENRQSVAAWFGGSARSEVVLRVANVGEITASDPAATVRIGRGPEPSNALAVPPLGEIGIGETVEVRAPVEFGAPAFGEYRVTVSIDGFDEPIFVSSATSVYPWALIVIGWLVLQIPLLGLYRRKRPVPATSSAPAEDEPVDPLAGFGPVDPLDPPGSDGAGRT